MFELVDLVGRTVWVVVQQDLQLVRAEHHKNDADWRRKKNYGDNKVLVIT